MKTLLIAVCLVLAIATCSDCVAQCSGGSCSLPGRPVVRAGNVVRAVVVRPFRRQWFGRFSR